MHRVEDQHKVQFRNNNCILVETDRADEKRWYKISVNVDKYKEFLI
jgi:hypothetical protein